MTDDFDALYAAAGGPTLDTGELVNSIVWENLRAFHDAGVRAGFTDAQVWEVSKEIMLAAILPTVFGTPEHGGEDDA